jgi:serine/threonine-protein kinase
LELYQRASSLGEDERELFLNRECGDDHQLRRLVEAMLSGEDETIDGVLTGPADPHPPPPPPPPPAPKKSDGFSAGDVFADRYRIVSLLGRGAMGEVYRAHDTVLDVPVAIKFVLGARSDFRKRMIKEVRLAREVTHPAVCRVYDVGHHDDRLFFTMEYIQGEDLATLRSRIGRLPSDKVTDIARQILGGLAAAHAKSVIHRDLKPANIMIDDRGSVRITDFGIAVTSDEGETAEFAGTPAYMAPEQLNPDAAVGPRADLYAVGLILHEMLTDRKMFEQTEFTDIFRAKMRTRPEPPSALVPGVDPRLERVVMEAISRSPDDRPPSALAMAAELPGGDPLGMAVEAGVLAGPELVAAATVDRPFKRSNPFILLAVLVVALAGVLALADPSTVFEDVRMIKTPAVLVDRSEQLLEGLGLDGPSSSLDYGFLDSVVAADPIERVMFWYRLRSPRQLPEFVRRNFESGAAFGDMDVPEAFTSEPLFVMLNPAGDLTYLNVGGTFGSKVAGQATDHDAFDWSRLIEAAGLDSSILEPDHDVTLPVFADRRAAWIGGDPAGGGTTVRVHAAAYEGLPVYFSAETVDAESPLRLEQIRRRANLQRYVRNPIYLLVVLMALGLGIHAVMKERSDLRGAGILAALVTALGILAAVLAAGQGGHPLTTGQLTVVGHVLEIVSDALAVGLCYLGLEPLIRRYRPQILIAWSRLLAGQVADRTVGSSLLVGALAGSVMAAIAELDRIAVAAMKVDLSWGLLGADQLNAVTSLGTLLSTALTQLDDAVVGGVLAAVVLVVLSRLVRAKVVAWTLYVVIVALASGIESGSHLPLSILTLGVATGVWTLVVLYRFGLLTLVLALLCQGLIMAFPMTLTRGVWFAQGGFFALSVVLLIGLAGALLARSGGKVGAGTSTTTG